MTQKSLDKSRAHVSHTRQSGFKILACISVAFLGCHSTAHSGYWMTQTERDSYKPSPKGRWYHNPEVHHASVVEDVFNPKTGETDTLIHPRMWVSAKKKNPALGWIASNMVPDINLVKLPDGDDFIFLSGWIESIYPVRTAGQPTPYSEALASCKTSQPNLTETDSFTTSTATGGFNQKVFANTKSNGKSSTASNTFGWKYSFDITGEFMGLKGPSMGGEINGSDTTSKTIDQTFSFTDTLMDQTNYNNVNSYTKTWSTSQVIPMGTVGTKSFSAPAVVVTGVFRMARLIDTKFFQFRSSENTALTYIPAKDRIKLTAAELLQKGYDPRNPTSQVYPIFSNDRPPGKNGSQYMQGTYMMGPQYYKSGWYRGVVTMAQKQLPGIRIPGESNLAATIWYIDSPPMTLAQYQAYCKGDFANHDYAPAMKAALCKAGIDKNITCK